MQNKQFEHKFLKAAIQDAFDDCSSIEELLSLKSSLEGEIKTIFWQRYNQKTEGRED